MVMFKSMAHSTSPVTSLAIFHATKSICNSTVFRCWYMTGGSGTLIKHYSELRRLTTWVL